MLTKCSLRCIQVIAGVLGRAGEEGQKKRLEAAKTGEVTWLPPEGLGRPTTEEDVKNAVEKKAAKPKVAEDETSGIRNRSAAKSAERDDDL
jgi:small subunit ribosomal protein S2